MINELNSFLDELEDNFDYISDAESFKRWFLDDSNFIELLESNHPPSRMDRYNDLKREFAKSFEIERSSRGHVIEPLISVIGELHSFFSLVKAMGVS